MRLLACDICEERYEVDAAMIEVKIPSYFFDDDSGVVLNLDVCTWECLMRMTEERFKEIQDQEAVPPEPPSDPPEPPQEMPKIKVKKKKEKEEDVHTPFVQPGLPGIPFGDMTDKELDELTMQITGVKKKW